MSDSDKGIGGRVRRVVSGVARTAGRTLAGRGESAPAPEKPAQQKPAEQRTAKPTAAKGASQKKPAAKQADKTSAQQRATAKASAAGSTGKRAAGAKAPATMKASKPVANRTGKAKTAAESATSHPAGRKKVTMKDTTSTAPPDSLRVLPGESPWTAEELEEVRAELDHDAQRLRGEIEEAEADIADMLREVGDVGGEDQADAGSKTFAREHEMALVASQREILAQTEQALARIADGTYGICENCGNPIGKARLQAFPRARLCMTCKQREERR